jgi:hypothetical protein
LSCIIGNSSYENTWKRMKCANNIKLVCKQFYHTCQSCNMQGIRRAFRLILNDQSRYCSFADSYYMIYRACLCRREYDVLNILKHESSRVTIHWFDAIRLKKLLNDVCMYLNKQIGISKYMNMKIKKRRKKCN